MIIALFRRYKVFFFVGFVILAVQVFLAYKSIKIPIETWTEKFSGKVISNKEKITKQKPTEDEDLIQSNLIQQQDVAHKREKYTKLLSELKFIPKCDIANEREVLSAIQRAKSQDCKQLISDIACGIKSNTFYPVTLPNTCPSGNYIANRSLGCYKDDKNHRLLPSFYTNFKDSNSPKKCIQICLQSGYLYAGVQYSKECFCGNLEPPKDLKLPDPSCNMLCPAEPKFACGGYYTINIYETGIAKFSPQVAESLPNSRSKKVKIVFLLTLNGRALRQVHRLIKSLYSVDHYYFIHVDSRQDYLYRELLKLESLFPNIRLSSKRFSTIWGGASLLEMLLSCMTDLLESDWEWDFVLNLSESDFPIKTIDKLEAFLSSNKNKNFVKSHGREAQRFIQKQGLDKTFVECDTHMWRIGDRELPSGIQIDGGSDWVCLSNSFVAYVTAEQNDELVRGLLKIFKQTLLPAESFFHTAIRNSLFCDSYIDNNLHITNWKRKMGCKCQYKSIVDWCGCSPNDFKPDDWPRLQGTENKQLFFGRKFEPVINQLVILQLEEWLYGPYPHDYVNLNSYWQNLYHSKDKSPTPREALLTVANVLIRINSKSNNAHQFYEPQRVLEVTDYWELDVYKGFLIKHEAKINNALVELETWCKPAHHHAQVSKSIKLAKKIMQLDVSSDFDQKELVSRNFARILSEDTEPVLILKLSGSSQVENSTANLTVLWVGPTEKVQETSELFIEDITITSINFVKSNLRQPLTSGTWTVKVFHKKSLIGLTKFLITPSSASLASNVTVSPNNLDKLIANFFLIKETCISYNHKTVREIVGIYLGAVENEKEKSAFHKFDECKRVHWSSSSPDPKSELSNEYNNIDGDGSS